MGYTSLSQSVRGQIAKDVLLQEGPGINSVQWVFSRSSVTGEIGPSGPLASALNKAGILFWEQP